MPITIDKDIVQFQVPANQRCIQTVSYNSSFEYYTAALSVSAKQSTMSLPVSGQKKNKKTYWWIQTNVGKESTFKAYTKPTTGNESLNNETNNNGIKMNQFAMSNGLNVRSTTFPHKDIQKRHGIQQTAGQRTK